MRTRRRDARGRPIAPGLLVLFLGCGGQGDGFGTLVGVEVEPETPSERREATTLIGYGVVNHWHRIDPEPLAEALYENGLTLTGIEYFPWFEGGDCGCKLGGGCSVESFPDEAVAFVEAMRDRGITTFVTLVNWNNCAVRDEDDDWFRDRLAEVVDRIGTEKVILAPVSEPWVYSSEVPERWARIAEEEWPGELALPGSDASDGDPPWDDLAYDFVDVHHCSDEALFLGIDSDSPDRIHSTDCSPIVNPGPERSAAFTRAALDAEANLFVYGFSDTEADVEVIEAMGEEIGSP